MSPPPPAAVWKPPPNGHAAKYPAGAGAVAGNGEAAARLSPDSGRGSDRTGSDTSNSYSDKEQHGGHGGHPKSHPSHLPAGLPPPPNPNGGGKQFGSHPSSMHHPQQQQQQYFPAPAYRYVVW